MAALSLLQFMVVNVSGGPVVLERKGVLKLSGGGMAAETAMEVPGGEGQPIPLAAGQTMEIPFRGKLPAR